MHRRRSRRSAETRVKLRNCRNGWEAGSLALAFSPRNGLVFISVTRSGSLQCGFKKPGKNGMNIYRAVMVTGPPGIGKTTSAHLCAKLAGFTPIELNASDARSKKLVENSTNIMNASLDGWMHGGHVSETSLLLVIFFDLFTADYRRRTLWA